MDPTMPWDDRIKAIIDLCHMYWEGEAFLVRSCMPINQTQTRENYRDNAEAATAVHQAMELRFLIQDCLIVAESEHSESPGAFRLYMLLTPGLKLSCVQDACQCNFKQQQSHLIFELVCSLFNALTSIS